ncbi:hypothetical protein [Desulfoluna limicola]|uniref:hypothetical protein n=1 Tax=Desulfoluna limicola TaxID=2810562 RepID=UPI001F3A68C0|nr:hypothetical protein [Desulfoluna limicola]
MTDQAVIDAANARSLSTQAIGLGFLDDTQSELTPIDKSVELLSGASVKGPSGIPGMGITDLLEMASEPLYTAFGPLFGGPVFNVGNIEDLIKNGATAGTPFPNISDEGSFSSTITGTMTSETNLTYEGTMTFTGATHCLSDDSLDCDEKATFNGALTYAVEFNFELPSPLPDGWDSMSPFQKVLSATEKPIPPESGTWSETEQMCYILSNITPEKIATDYHAASNGEFTVKTDLNDASYKMVRRDPVKATILNTVDGSFSKKQLRETNYDTNGYGSDTSQGSTVFSGDLYVTMEMTTIDSTTSLDFSAQDASVTVAKSDVESRTPEIAEVVEGTPIAVSANDTTTIDVTGNVSLNFSAASPSDTLDLSATLNGGTFRLSYDENTDEDRLATSTTTYNASTKVKTDNSEKQKVTIAGNLDLNGVYTTFLLTPVTQNLGLTINAGTVEFIYATSQLSTNSPETQESNATIGVIVDGDIMVTNGVEPITLVGDLAFDLETRSVRDVETPDNNAQTTTGTLTIDKLAVKTGVIDTAAKGTITFEIAYQAPAEAREIAETPTLNLAMDLLLKNNTQDKTYWLNNYKISTPLSFGDKADSPSYDVSIAVEGRYYHPDHGYVDITTGITPFIMNDGAIMEGFYRNNKPLLLQALFPIQGQLTVQGAEGTQALLEALGEEDTASGYVLPSGYTIHLDADGNGSFDASGTYDWPNLKDLIERVWLTRLLYNSSDLLFILGPK